LMRTFESYLKESAEGALAQVKNPALDEGVICNFMAPRYLKQANLPGFLPSVAPALLGKPCTGVEGACGSGGRALATAIRTVLSDSADAVLVVGFEVQNTMKAVYGADVLAGAGYYNGQRKDGHAHFFPGVFSDRAGAYYQKYGAEQTRKAMAKWYETSILNARKNPKAQEYQNADKDLLARGMTPPEPDRFVPHLNLYDCSKITDGASALIVFSDAGLERAGLKTKDAVQVVGLGAAEGDITQPPADMTLLSTTAKAAAAAYEQAGIKPADLAALELHDCFSISAVLALEATGFTENGAGAKFILSGETAIDGRIPTNLSGGLGGFGHPVGATGVRQMTDLLHQLTGRAANQAALKRPYAMMVSMGGNDITVTAIIVKATEA
ncbi:MAG TPA: 3-ketoacyl-CoA thiolase, partial [Kiritimatiellia bacterium]